MIRATEVEKGLRLMMKLVYGQMELMTAQSLLAEVLERSKQKGNHVDLNTKLHYLNTLLAMSVTGLVKY